MKNIKQTQKKIILGSIKAKNLDFHPISQGIEWKDNKVWDYIMEIDSFISINQVQSALKEQKVEVAYLNRDTYLGFETGTISIKAYSVHNDGEVNLEFYGEKYSMIKLQTRIQRVRATKMAKQNNVKSKTATLPQKKKPLNNGGKKQIYKPKNSIKLENKFAVLAEKSTSSDISMEPNSAIEEQIKENHSVSKKPEQQVAIAQTANSKQIVEQLATTNNKEIVEQPVVTATIIEQPTVKTLTVTPISQSSKQLPVPSKETTGNKQQQSLPTPASTITNKINVGNKSISELTKGVRRVPPGTNSND